MNQGMLLTCAPMIGLLAWAAATDLHRRRIPNYITAALALTGLAQSFLPLHIAGPSQALLGLAVGFGLGLILFLLGALGGGDVKLLAGVGAWLGGYGALLAFMAAAIVGLCIVVPQALWQRRFGRLLRNSALVALNMAHVGEVGIETVRESGQSCRAVEKPLPYAVPVFVGTVLLLALAGR